MDCQNACDSGSDEDNCITVQIPQDNSKSCYSVQDLVQECMNVEYIERDCERCGQRIINSYRFDYRYYLVKKSCD